jgi:hypothetical protein
MSWVLRSSFLVPCLAGFWEFVKAEFGSKWTLHICARSCSMGFIEFRFSAAGAKYRYFERGAYRGSKYNLLTIKPPERSRPTRQQNRHAQGTLM